MSTLRLIALAAIIGATTSLPVQAVLIDSFDDTQSVSASSGSTPTSSTTAGGMIGGDRDVTANWTAGPNSVDADVNAGSSSLLNISIGASTNGSVDVVYDGVGGVGLGGVDLTDGGTLNTIILGIPFDDLPVDIEIVALSLTGSSRLEQLAPGGVFSPISVPYTFDFFEVLSGTGADFSAITGLELHITPLFPATDLQIDFIESVFIEPSVPEPSTFVMAALGLLGLGFIGMKRRRA